MLICKVQPRGVAALCAFIEPVSAVERRFSDWGDEYYMDMGEKNECTIIRQNKKNQQASA